MSVPFIEIIDDKLAEIFDRASEDQYQIKDEPAT
jgi:hypothetical protein